MSQTQTQSLRIINIIPINTYLFTYLRTYVFHRAESRNSPHFMEPEGSVPHPQVAAICP